MGKISVADIVFVSFPFSNLSNTKLRPALVLADAQKGDWILCQITSKSYSDNQAIEINETDYKSGNLEIVSYVRPAKLFTANQDLIVKNIAALKAETHQKIVNAIFNILTNGK
jgi:mRNA interferase MazF